MNEQELLTETGISEVPVVPMNEAEETRMVGRLHRRPIAFHGRTFRMTLDFERLTNNLQRVFSMLMDGQWHSAYDLANMGGSNWGARVRSLREDQFGNMRVDSVRSNTGAGGEWLYKLDLDTVQLKVASALLEGRRLSKSKTTTKVCPHCGGSGRV